MGDLLSDEALAARRTQDFRTNRNDKRDIESESAKPERKCGDQQRIKNDESSAFQNGLTIVWMVFATKEYLTSIGANANGVNSNFDDKF